MKEGDLLKLDIYSDSFMYSSLNPVIEILEESVILRVAQLYFNFDLKTGECLDFDCSQAKNFHMKLNKQHLNYENN